MEGKKWGHDELASDLADHLASNPARMIWEDMQMGPSGSPRPDVYSINKSYSNPSQVSYEIKISVSDFRSDVTSGKWMKYLEFSGAVIFCVPKGLINKSDIPDKCGLMVRSEKGWRSVKKPTIQQVNMPFNVMQKLLIDGIDRERSVIKSNLFERVFHYKDMQKKFGDDVARVIRDFQWAKGSIERNELRAETIISNAYTEAKRIKESALNDAKEQEAIAGNLWPDLCEILGLKNASKYSISREIQRLRNELSESDRLQDSERHIKRALSEMNIALSKVKTEDE